LSYSLDSLATEFPQAKTFKLRLSWTDDSKFNTFDLLYSPSSNTP
jgi:hypothetical protein